MNDPTDHRLQAVHHVGMTVADLDRAVAFWRQLLDQPPRDRRLLAGPNLGRLVGYQQPRIISCWFDLPGGTALELLEYHTPTQPGYEPGTAHPGNVHLCLQVADLDAAHTHAVDCGAVTVGDGPIEVPEGPAAGMRIVYLRVPDRATLELRQPPAGT